MCTEKKSRGRTPLAYFVHEISCAEFTESPSELLRVRMCTFFYEMGNGCAGVRARVQVLMHLYTHVHACPPRQALNVQMPFKSSLEVLFDRRSAPVLVCCYDTKRGFDFRHGWGREIRGRIWSALGKLPTLSRTANWQPS